MRCEGPSKDKEFCAYSQRLLICAHETFILGHPGQMHPTSMIGVKRLPLEKIAREVDPVFGYTHLPPELVEVAAPDKITEAPVEGCESSIIGP